MEKNNNREINYKELRRGDLQLISEVTGYSKQYVWLVLKGERKNEYITNTCKTMLELREQLIKKTKKNSEQN
ncbi:MAG: hypothetical protein Q8880_10780 [Bacteroidota bacterium]|nr:hypothetical protein [Bacteroidota bacterium]